MKYLISFLFLAMALLEVSSAQGTGDWPPVNEGLKKVPDLQEELNQDSEPRILDALQQLSSGTQNLQTQIDAAELAGNTAKADRLRKLLGKYNSKTAYYENMLAELKARSN